MRGFAPARRGPFVSGNGAIRWRFIFLLSLSVIPDLIGDPVSFPPLHVHVAIDCQSKSHDNAGTVARERNCTVTLLTKKANFDDET